MFVVEVSDGFVGVEEAHTTHVAAEFIVLFVQQIGGLSNHAQVGVGLLVLGHEVATRTH